MNGETAARLEAPMQLSLARGGLSAAAEADARQEAIDLVTDELDRMQTLLGALKSDQAKWRAGAAGEAQVVEVLLDIGQAGWFVLADRRWPGTAKANLDVVVVGPGGVFVIDVKTWRDARVESGTLWHGQVDEGAALRSMLDQCGAVEDVLSAAGYPPSQVTPVLVLAGRAQAGVLLGGVWILGERNLHRELLRRGRLLTDDEVTRLVATLDTACPPKPVRPVAAHRPSGRPRPTRSPHVAKGATPVTGHTPAIAPHGPQTSILNDPAALIDAQDLIDALMVTACAGPIESWMTWLHPEQSALVKRSWNGPARISGAAGTGKTVVALHRAKYLARHSPGRILVTSFVRTVPTVQRALFERLAPGITDQVEFAHLHSWAQRLLRQRGHRVTVDASAARSAFNRAWLHVGRSSSLDAMSVSTDYWYDELIAVIKGRGITDPEDYYALDRIGRRTVLRRPQREAVWDLYTEYERLKTERGTLDWADLILQARDEVRAHPVTDYSAVIVDEVQDLSVVGLQLLHSLVGDTRDGLLLVGDGQQSIYTGSFTATEAGLSLTGRAAILRRNYRNGGNILRRALEVVAQDEFADLEQRLAPGTRDVDVIRPGGQVTELSAADEDSAVAALNSAVSDLIENGTRPGDLAVLCGTNERALTWARRLRTAGIQAMSLTDYDGLPINHIKVGTYHRAKGLEFAHVFIPDLHQTPRPRAAGETEDAFQERCELEHRQLFVAMTRARDGLWLCRIDTAATSGPATSIDSAIA